MVFMCLVSLLDALKVLSVVLIAAQRLLFLRCLVIRLLFFEIASLLYHLLRCLVRLQGMLKLCSLLRADVVVLSSDELTNSRYSPLLHFLFVIDPLEQVLAECRLEEMIERLWINHTSHQLQPCLLDVVICAIKVDLLWNL